MTDRLPSNSRPVGHQKTWSPKRPTFRLFFGRTNRRVPHKHRSLKAIATTVNNSIEADNRQRTIAKTIAGHSSSPANNGTTSMARFHVSLTPLRISQMCTVKVRAVKAALSARFVIRIVTDRHCFCSRFFRPLQAPNVLKKIKNIIKVIIRIVKQRSLFISLREMDSLMQRGGNGG